MRWRAAWRLVWLPALLLVLAAAAVEALYWPLHDYPHAPWHFRPRGDDIELAQANAANAGWEQLLGYWFGRTIHGHGYYRPLTSWLFVLEYRLFATDDRKWALVNIALHLGVVVALFGFVWLAAAPQGRSLPAATIAGLAFSAPHLADRTIGQWVIGWWPCQSEHLSLLAGLVCLAGALQFARTGTRRSAAVCVAGFTVSVLFKEMGYVAGLAACLLCLRPPRARKLLVGVAVTGLALWGLRYAALASAGGLAHGVAVSSAGRRLLGVAEMTGASVLRELPHLMILGAAVAAAGVLRRRPPGDRLGVAVLTYGALVLLLFGNPTEPHYTNSAAQTARLVAVAAAVAGMARAARYWPVPEIAAIWVMACVVVAGYPPTFGWYRYWGAAFGCALTGIGLSAWLPRLTPRVEPASPTSRGGHRDTPQLAQQRIRSPWRTP